MLVLSRKRDEKILLQREGDEDIEVTVVRIDAHKVRIGIQADSKTIILRSELVEKPSQAKQLADAPVT